MRLYRWLFGRKAKPAVEAEPLVEVKPDPPETKPADLPHEVPASSSSFVDMCAQTEALLAVLKKPVTFAEEANRAFTLLDELKKPVEPLPPLIQAMNNAAPDAMVIKVLPGGEPLQPEPEQGPPDPTVALVARHKLKPPAEPDLEMSEYIVLIDKLCLASAKTNNTLSCPASLSLIDTGLYNSVLSNMSHAVRADLFAKGGMSLVRETVLEIVQKLRAKENKLIVEAAKEDERADSDIHWNRTQDGDTTQGAGAQHPENHQG